jgi:hypothetical protein
VKVNIGDYTENDEDRIVSVQIDPWDTWSLDHTLARIIYPALIQLREKKQGVPHEVVASITPNWEYSDMEFAEAERIWDEILSKMIEAFRLITEDDYEDLATTEPIIREGLELFGKYFRCLWT